MKVALCGFSQGYYAVEYTRYLREKKGIIICGVCDLNEEDSYIRSCAFVNAKSFADELETELLHSVDDVIAVKPDAVLLCCETAQHTELAARLVRAGIHVFVSKPLSFRADQVDTLARVVPKDRVVLCGQPLRYETGIQELAGRIQAGEAGRIYSIRIRLCHEAMIHQAWERDPAKSGGPFGTYGVYLFDLAQWFGGTRLSRLYASGINACTPQIDDPDTVFIFAEENGIQFKLELFSAVGLNMPFIQAEITGDQGLLQTNYACPASTLYTDHGVYMGSYRTSDMTKGEMEHFLSCLKGKAEPACGIESMRYIARCIEAARVSMRTNQFVAVGEA